MKSSPKSKFVPGYKTMLNHLGRQTFINSLKHFRKHQVIDSQNASFGSFLRHWTGLVIISRDLRLVIGLLTEHYHLSGYLAGTYAPHRGLRGQIEHGSVGKSGRVSMSPELHFAAG